MLISNHVLAGALVGAVAPGPVSAFAGGMVSHFAMDVVPHWGNEDRSVFLRVAVVDGLVGLALMGWAARRSSPGLRTRVVAGMAGSCLPDADKPSELFLGRSPFPAAVDDWHARIQTEHEHRMPQEVVVAALQALLVSRAVRRHR